MPTCHGSTKSGSRCKRTVTEGEQFCSAHTGQASDESQETETCCESLCESDPIDALLALAVGGAIIVTALVFRRVFKVF